MSVGVEPTQISVMHNINLTPPKPFVRTHQMMHQLTIRIMTHHKNEKETIKKNLFRTLHFPTDPVLSSSFCSLAMPVPPTRFFLKQGPELNRFCPSQKSAIHYLLSLTLSRLLSLRRPECYWKYSNPFLYPCQICFIILTKHSLLA